MCTMLDFCILFGDICKCDEESNYCKDSKSCCYNPLNYPTTSVGWAYLICVFNWFPFTSGLGTMIIACKARDCEYFFKIFGMGILHSLLTPILIGWLLSIKYSLDIFMKAREASSAAVGMAAPDSITKIE